MNKDNEQREIKKLTKKQKQMLHILREDGSITTDPPSRRHNTMLALVRKGFAVNGERFTNIFRPI